MSLAVHCVEEDPACPMPPRDQVQLWARSAWLAADQQHCELSVINQDEAKMRSLNHGFRGRDQVTNVLAFPMHEQMDGVLYVGDVICCGAVIGEQARQQDKVFEHHWAHLVVHAVLHLQSYTHDHADDAKLMESIEVKILASLDIPNPY